jgi:hypothetical protein
VCVRSAAQHGERDLPSQHNSNNSNRAAHISSSTASAVCQRVSRPWWRSNRSTKRRLFGHRMPMLHVYTTCAGNAIEPCAELLPLALDEHTNPRRETPHASSSRSLCLVYQNLQAMHDVWYYSSQARCFVSTVRFIVDFEVCRSQGLLCFRLQGHDHLHAMHRWVEVLRCSPCSRWAAAV